MVAEGACVTTQGRFIDTLHIIDDIMLAAGGLGTACITLQT